MNTIKQTCRLCLIFAAGYVLGILSLIIANSYNYVLMVQIVPSAIHLTENLAREIEGE